MQETPVADALEFPKRFHSAFYGRIKNVSVCAQVRQSSRAHAFASILFDSECVHSPEPMTSVEREVSLAQSALTSVT